MADQERGIRPKQAPDLNSVIISHVSNLVLLRTALDELMREAGQMAIDLREGHTREFKPDGSIVTNADHAVEEFLRGRLRALLPGCSFWGEEMGYEPPNEDGWWLIDPIDGTTNYSYGSPLWGVSVALYRKGRIELGAVALPDLNEWIMADVDSGATLNGTAMRQVPSGKILKHDPIGYNDSLQRQFPDQRWPGKMRHFGAFVIEGVFAATGRLRGLISRSVKLYDAAAVFLISEQVGMEIRYVDGSDFELRDATDNQKIAKPFSILPQGNEGSILDVEC